MKSRTILAVALLLAAGASNAADGLSVGVGADYSTGDYGSDTTTEIWSVPFNVRYASDNWTWKATLPWMRVDGDASVVPGLGNVGNSNPKGRGRGNGNGNGNAGGDPTSPATTDSGSASGIGDLRLTGIYAFDTGTDIGVDLGATIKIATADEDKGLGTGANDYGLTVDLYRDFGGALVFGGVGYTMLGDSQYIDTNAVASANAGVSWPVGDSNMGVMYDWREAATETADDRSELTGFYGFRTGEASKWQLYGTLGLSDGSPDWGAGVAYNWLF